MTLHSLFYNLNSRLVCILCDILRHWVNNLCKAAQLSLVESKGPVIDGDTNIAMSILHFLHVSPKLLLAELLEPQTTLDFFEPLLFCVLSPETRVRELATEVASNVFEAHPESFRQFQIGGRFGTTELRQQFWHRR